MEGYIMATGKKITCMDKATTNGLMAANMKGGTMRIRRMDMEYISIQMADAIKEFGKMENNTEKAYL